MLISSCTNTLLKHFDNEVITMCIDKWNWYEDKREDYNTIYIHKSELKNTINNSKLKWKLIAYQYWIFDWYYDLDYVAKVEWYTENLFK